MELDGQAVLMARKCHHIEDPETGELVHIPGCWGGAVHGPSRCNCYKFEHYLHEAFRKIEHDERDLAVIGRYIARRHVFPMDVPRSFQAPLLKPKPKRTYSDPTIAEIEHSVRKYMHEMFENLNREYGKNAVDYMLKHLDELKDSADLHYRS